MIRSVIAKNLVANYRKTHYQIGTGTGSILLRIDQYSASLAELLIASEQSCAAIISAFNPYSQLVSDKENLAAHESLRNYLHNHSYAMIEGLNIDPTHLWPTEKSFFVPRLDLNTAKLLGQQFKQNAMVWIKSNAIPRLILLR